MPGLFLLAPQVRVTPSGAGADKGFSRRIEAREEEGTSRPHRHRLRGVLLCRRAHQQAPLDAGNRSPLTSGFEKVNGDFSQFKLGLITPAHIGEGDARLPIGTKTVPGLEGHAPGSAAAHLRRQELQHQKKTAAATTTLIQRGRIGPLRRRAANSTPYAQALGQIHSKIAVATPRLPSAMLSLGANWSRVMKARLTSPVIHLNR